MELGIDPRLTFVNSLFGLLKKKFVHNDPDAKGKKIKGLALADASALFARIPNGRGFI